MGVDSDIAGQKMEMGLPSRKEARAKLPSHQLTLEEVPGVFYGAKSIPRDYLRCLLCQMTLYETGLRSLPHCQAPDIYKRILAGEKVTFKDFRGKPPLELDVEEDGAGYRDADTL